MRPKSKRSTAPKAKCNLTGVTTRKCENYQHSGLCGAHGSKQCKFRGEK